MTINHYTNNTGFDNVASGTETDLTIATGIDDATNRSTHVPDGHYLKFVNVQLACTTIPAAITQFTAILWRRPGGDALTGPIADYYDSTDPLTAEAIRIRKFKLQGPFRTTKPASDFTAYRKTLKWRGNLMMRDGDDIVCTLLQDSGGALDFNAQISLGYK